MRVCLCSALTLVSPPDKSVHSCSVIDPSFIKSSNDPASESLEMSIDFSIFTCFSIFTVPDVDGTAVDVAEFTSCFINCCSISKIFDVGYKRVTSNKTSKRKSEPHASENELDEYRIAVPRIYQCEYTGTIQL